MRLTRFTDYTLRTLTHLARHQGSFVTIAEVAATFDISANHLMKVVQHLATAGDIVTMRGPHGGLRLARPAHAIRLGEVVRRAEPDIDLLRPLGHGHEPPDEAAHASDAHGTAVTTVMARARDAFFTVLDEYTVADLAGLTPGPEQAQAHQPRRTGQGTQSGGKP